MDPTIYSEHTRDPTVFLELPPRYWVGATAYHTFAEAFSAASAVGDSVAYWGGEGRPVPVAPVGDFYEREETP